MTVHAHLRAGAPGKPRDEFENKALLQDRCSANSETKIERKRVHYHDGLQMKSEERLVRSREEWKWEDFSLFLIKMDVAGESCCVPIEDSKDL